MEIPLQAPWKELAICEDSGGYLSYYFSDDLSSIPVRAVTKVGDNKVDPNLETRTYGLFSPCNKNMRKNIVKRGCQYIFFVTNIKGIRVLSGLYIVKWYAPISQNRDDFCLAADKIWFLARPIPLEQVDNICGTSVSGWWRTYLHVDSEGCTKIERLLKRGVDASGQYLSEIDRLERFNLRHGGYRYITSKIKGSYSWDCDRIRTVFKK